MSQSEDYLDGLLNSINKAKTDAVQIEEQAEKRQQEALEYRKAVAPEDDFLSAVGIDSSIGRKMDSHPNLRKAFSEADFLRDFENELSTGSADAFIDAFEQEIDDEERQFQETGVAPDYNDVVDRLLNNINDIVSNTEELPEDMNDNLDTVDDTDSDGLEVNTLNSDDLSNLLSDSSDTEDAEDMDSETEAFSSDDDSLDLESDELNLDDTLDLNLEDDSDSSDNNSMEEFAPDEMDALDAEEFHGEDDNISTDDLNLDGLFDDDGDLSDIQSLLDGEDLPADIDTGVEEDESDSSAKGKKGKKGKKEKKPKGEKKPNPFLQKLLTIIFGPDDDEDEVKPDAAALQTKDPSEMTEEELAVLASLDGEASEEPKEDPKAKKKKEKKEKPKKEPKEKKEKPKKEPKPKKEKKPKAPDNSPKIPLPVILIFLVLSGSIIGIVLLGMNYMGIQRHMSQAEDLYAEGDYIAAYEKLNGFDLTDEDVLLMRNQARVLADLQQCQDEYIAFTDKNQYDLALDSLIKGIYRYNKYQDEAEEYGISDLYDQFGNSLTQEAQDDYGLSEDDALNIYNQKNRHYYTIELKKVLIRNGLE